MQTQDGDTVEMELDDMSRLPLPAEGDLIADSLEGRIAVGEARVDSEDSMREPLSRRSEPTSNDGADGPDSDPHTDQRQSENAPNVPPLVTPPTVEAQDSKNRILEFVNGFTDSVVQKLKSFRAVAPRTDVESNIEGGLADTAQRTRKQHKARQGLLVGAAACLPIGYTE